MHNYLSLETLEAQTEQMSERIGMLNPRIESISKQIEVKHN